MSYSLNSLDGVLWELLYGTTIGDIKDDTWSLDYISDDTVGSLRGLSGSSSPSLPRYGSYCSGFGGFRV